MYFHGSHFKSTKTSGMWWQGFPKTSSDSWRVRVSDFPEKGRKNLVGARKEQQEKQKATCFALPKASLTRAAGHLMLKRLFFVSLNPLQRLSSLFVLDQKHLAVTLVSASDDIFSSLTSKGTEKSYLDNWVKDSVRLELCYSLMWQAENVSVAIMIIALLGCCKGRSDLGSKNWFGNKDIKIYVLFA